MKKLKYILTFVIVALIGLSTVLAQDLPVPKKATNWVNDYANVFSAQEEQQLIQKLNLFQYNHSTQIFVVTIENNNGYPVSTLAPMIGEEWQVGQEGKDNGLIVLLDMGARDVFITTGYGIEEYVPDAIAKRIVENEVLPNFKQGNFYAGVDQATDVIISLLQGKFTPDEYREQTRSSSGGGSAIGGLFFMIMMFSFLFGSRRRSYGTGGRSNLPLWIALGMMSGGSRSSGGFGNFSSGSGGFGGGGGFGGFTGGGGGSFGGGGAGGSW